MTVVAAGGGADDERLQRVQHEIDELNDRIQDTHALDRLLLVQRRIDREADLAELQRNNAGFHHLEDQFVEVAAEWAARAGVSYTALRRSGIPAEVLTRAGIARRAS